MKPMAAAAVDSVTEPETGGVEEESWAFWFLPVQNLLTCHSPDDMWPLWDTVVVPEPAY